MHKYFSLLIPVLLLSNDVVYANNSIDIEIAVEHSTKTVQLSLKKLAAQYSLIEKGYSELQNKFNKMWVARRLIKAFSVAFSASPFAMPAYNKYEILNIGHKIGFIAFSAAILYSQWFIKLDSYSNFKKEIMKIKGELQSFERQCLVLPPLEGSGELLAKIVKTIADFDKEIEAIEAYEQRSGITQCFLP